MTRVIALALLLALAGCGALRNGGGLIGNAGGTDGSEIVEVAPGVYQVRPAK